MVKNGACKVMKKNIHPQWYPNAKIYLGNDVVAVVGSTKEEIRVDIWSGTHPFWTGKQQLVDVEKRADKFDNKIANKKSTVELAKKKEKLAARVAKAKEVNTTKKLTLKDMMKGLK